MLLWKLTTLWETMGEMMPWKSLRHFAGVVVEVGAVRPQDDVV